MNVIVDFTHNFFHSGIGTYSRELVKAMAALAPESIFYALTLFRKRKVVERHFAEIPNVYCKQFFPNDLILGKAFKGLIQKIKFIIWRFFFGRFELVHFTDPLYFVEGVRNAVVTIHDIIPLYKNGYQEINREKLWRYKTDVIVREAVKIIVPSFFVLQELERFFPDAIGKITVVYEGVKKIFSCRDVDPAVLQLYGLPEEGDFFLVVGRLEERKNIESVVDAFSNMQRNEKQTSFLVIVGNGSDSAVRALNEKVVQRGMQKSVLHLTGVPDEDLVHLYNAALALVFVSYSEGFGLPLVEAMNCGCPAIVSNCSSLPEIANGSALLVDPASVGEISEAMRRMLENKDLRNSLVERGKIVVKRYSWEETARQTLDVYKQVIAFSEL